MTLLPKLVSKEVNLFIFWLLVSWTVAILSSLIWNIASNRCTAVDIALVHARKSFEKDLLVRRWNASHGGVYVPTTETTPPNPYLSSISERDITTPSGRKLTMINPAYMTRQLHELAFIFNGDAGHITSLKPIRRGNSPDGWETEALKSFDNGNTEAYTIVEREGKDYLRFMRPLLTEKTCLICHAKQGYSQGMVRGGISVIVPVPPWNKMGWYSNIALFSAHFLLWVMGLFLITFVGRRINTATLQRQHAENKLAQANQNLEIKIAERTSEYEEVNERLHDEIVDRSKVQEKLRYSIEQWRETFDVMSDFVSVHDNDLRFVKVNKSLANILKKKPEELIGKHCYEVIHNSQEPWPTCPHLKAIEKQGVVTEEIEDPFLEKTLLVTCSPVFDKKGVVIGSVHVARDVTSQKLAEKEREALVKKLQTTLDEIKILKGILPFCSYCKKIRDDKGYWEQVDVYIHKYSDADISHGICPECLKEHYPDLYEDVMSKMK